MRTLVGDDEFVQPKRNQTAPRSECRLTFKMYLTQPRLLEMDQIQAAAMNEGVRRKKTLWSKTGRRQLEALPLAPWATRRRQDLLELMDRLNTTIGQLTAATSQHPRKRPELH